MTPEQLEQIKVYRAIIPTIPERKIRKKHEKKVRLFIEQDGNCCICDKAMILRHGGNRGSCATFEHVVCRSDGGSSKIENVPLSCGDCNSRRGKKDFHSFREEVKRNGGVLPKPPKNKKSLLHLMARQGEPEAMEHFLAKRLNLALYVLSLEEGWREPEGKSVEELYLTLAKPLDFGGNDHVSVS